MQSDLELAKAGDAVVAYFYNRVRKQAKLLRRAPPPNRTRKKETLSPEEIRKKRLAQLARIKHRRKHAQHLLEGAETFLAGVRSSEDEDVVGYFRSIRSRLCVHHGMANFPDTDYAATTFYEISGECLERMSKLETLLHLRYAYPQEVERRAAKIVSGFSEGA